MHRRRVAFTAAAVVLGASAVALVVGLTRNDAPDLRSVGSSSAEGGRVAYGVDAAHLPAGYEAPAAAGALAPAETADADAGSVTADVYQVGNRKVAVLTGPSEALESFVPAGASESQPLAGGRLADVFVDLSSPDRVAVAVRASEDGGWEKVAIADGAPGDTQSLVDLAAAADGPAGARIASGRLDAFARLRPAAVATYDGPEPGTEVDVVTMAGTELDPVVAEVVSQPPDVTIDGRPGLAFSGESEREFVAWEPTDGTLVVVAGPSSLGRDALVALAAQAQHVDTTAIGED